MKKVCPEYKGEEYFQNQSGTDWTECEECLVEGTAAASVDLLFLLTRRL
ncbi:hypothetical protein V7150_22070 [Neobacillus drentensis]